ncbi:UNVERIFIED_CONTAM: hypothetical protein GTU68_054845, partial [Idotea baltica]|nr:hypothetical protein [Idotea baltica]MCL4150934.1 hypothetical protein [Idotea baltica]
DDFDPRAEESPGKGGGFESPPDKGDALRLNGIGNFPALVPPPRPSRPQDKLTPTTPTSNLLEGGNDPFSLPPQGGDLLAQFDQMKVRVRGSHSLWDRF